MGNSLIRSILEVHLPHSLHRSATVKAPANRLPAHSLGRYKQGCESDFKQSDDD